MTNAPLILAIDLVWRPVIAPPQVLALALLLAAFTAWGYRKSVRARPLPGSLFLFMRLLAIAALAAILMGPSVLPAEATAPARAKLTLLLDTSASMLTTDAADAQPRISSVVNRWLSDPQLDALRKSFDLRLLGFDETPHPLGSAALRQDPNLLASGRTSRYVQTLTTTLLEQSPDQVGSAIVVLGDGHDTDDAPLDSVVSLARTRHVAIHAVAVGGTRLGKDVAIAALPLQDYLAPKETGQVMIRLYQVGLDDASVSVHMKRGDEQVDRRVSFGGKPSATLELPITGGDPGLAEYQVWADPVDGESVLTNNRQSVFVQVSERPMRVFVLEGEPYWDTKFIAQSLRGDVQVQVNSLMQVNASKQEQIATRNDDGASIVPRSVKALSQFDVIIVGRGIDRVMGPGGMKALVQYVAEGGGHVVFARGRPYDPDTPEGRAASETLAPLEPVNWGIGSIDESGKSRLKPTPSGRASPLFTFTGLGSDPEQVLAALPGLSRTARVSNLKPATIVLATTGPGGGAAEAQSPAIVAMNYGRGRVVSVLGEGLWRWSLLPPELKQYRGAYDAFWSNTVRWLALGGEFQPGQQVSLKLGRASVRLGDPLVFDVATKANPPGFAPMLRLIDPDGKEQTLRPDPIPGVDLRRQATMTPDKAGVWRVILSAPPLTPATQERRFSVYDVNMERLRTDARPAVMKALADQTGGLFFDADDPADLAHELARQQSARLVPPRPVYAWDTGWFLTLLLVWVGIEWIGRRQAGWL
jgi:hypothetical protein